MRNRIQEVRVSLLPSIAGNGYGEAREGRKEEDVLSSYQRWINCHRCGAFRGHVSGHRCDGENRAFVEFLIFGGLMAVLFYVCEGYPAIF